jgi:hypothetical protein
MRIKEFEEMFGFKPKFGYHELGFIFKSHPFIKIENTKLLDLIKNLQISHIRMTIIQKFQRKNGIIFIFWSELGKLEQ